MQLSPPVSLALPPTSIRFKLLLRLLLFLPLSLHPCTSPSPFLLGLLLVTAVVVIIFVVPMNSYSKGRFKAGFQFSVGFFSALPGRFGNLLCFTFFVLCFLFVLVSKRFFCFYFWKTRELWVTNGAKKSNWLWSLSLLLLFILFFVWNGDAYVCSSPLFPSHPKVNRQHAKR